MIIEEISRIHFNLNHIQISFKKNHNQHKLLSKTKYGVG